MKKYTDNNHSTIDWDQLDDIWYIAGYGTVHLEESALHGGGTPNWTLEEMDAVFINKAKVQAEYPFPIKWEAFEEKYGVLIFRMGRPDILTAVLVFSLLGESSIKPTIEFYTDIQNRLGVQLADHGDDFSSMLPDFYYKNGMTSEEFFFDHFLKTNCPYVVRDPVKFAFWVLSDHRWRALVTLQSI